MLCGCEGGGGEQLCGQMVTDGPYAETKEMFVGYYLIEAVETDGSTCSTLVGRIRTSTRSESVPTISVFYGIVIRMFFRDHAPPHFHVEYVGQKAEIAIDTLDVLAGSLPRRTLALVLEWAALHRTELRTDWELCRQHRQPNPIEPLE